MDQSLLITGVSGSGKTQTAKHAIEFLSGESNLSSKTVVKSSIILEMFGNAKTNMNSNSSRFCKYIEVNLLFFEQKCTSITVNSFTFLRLAMIQNSDNVEPKYLIIYWNQVEFLLHMHMNSISISSISLFLERRNAF